jgi:hypothetical protein
MRSKEFLPESMGGTTTSGSMATVDNGLGGELPRYKTPTNAKYRNTAPEVIKKRNKHARR